MAIDSREKRQSLANRMPLPPTVTPNASKDKEWRQEAGWGYPGVVPQGQIPFELPHFRGLLRTPGKLMH